MSKQEEQQLSPAEAAPKKGLVQSAQAFMNGVLSPLKGRDVGQMVEEFTSEMTLVAEGLSEDQARLQERMDRLEAEHTQLEAHLQDQLHERRWTRRSCASSLPRSPSAWTRLRRPLRIKS